jgi:hypothetical protein
MSAVIDAVTVSGFIVAVAAVAWWFRRRQRDVDAYHQREYREPPVFQNPDGGPY